MTSTVPLAQDRDLASTDVTIVYIMGYGRSGSTILDILLGNHDEIVSTGELCNLYRYVADDGVCACGSKISQCEVWSALYEEFDPVRPHLSHYRQDQLTVERRRSLRRLLRNDLPFELTSSYGKAMRDLFTEIARISGRRFVVDSSKSATMTAGRGYALKAYSNLDVKLIYLVRDGRAVMWSAMKGPGRPENRQSSVVPLRALRAMIGWILANGLYPRVGKRQNEELPLVVRYEDLVSDPEKELMRIGEFLGINMEELVQTIRSQAPLAVGHNLAGNRVRFAGNIVLKADLEWLDKLPHIYRIGFWLIARPVARKFGYRFVW